MKRGHLSEYFTGIAAKRLTAVEVDAGRSNQHEFNGSDALKSIFGRGTERIQFPAKFLYLSDHDDEAITEDGFLTWYDARANHETRSEHRLYFPTTTVSTCAEEGDLLVIGRRPDNSVLVVVAEGGSTICSQIEWLFGLSDLLHPGFSVRAELESNQDKIAFASNAILESIGVEVAPPPETLLDEMLRRFGGTLPTTKIFSAFARSTLPEVDPVGNEDAALMAWMEREEILFRTLERHLIADRLSHGFDVEDFLSFSLSVQNRRKSRVGYALENHLEQIFMANNLSYDRTAVTENKARPDFLFPGAKEYHDPGFPVMDLTMLGVKSTCKDRWRQVLSEANRIEEKHLLTFEAAISDNQTDEMKSKRLQLVVPSIIHQTYKPSQQPWLLKVSDFVSIVRIKEGP